MIKDGIEILFFAALIYYFMRWLNKDRQKNLIIYFYCYCMLTIMAHCCSLTSVTFFLVYGFPVIATLFVIVHQDILQRNFVALHNITLSWPEQQTEAWYEILMRSLLVLLHKQQETLCVIEQQHSLASFITTPFMLHTPLQPGILETLLESSKKNVFVWMNNRGIIHSTQSSWIPHENIVTNENKSAQEWLQEALLFTSKTDALILSTTTKSRSFTFIAQGKIQQGLTADHMVRILQGAHSHVQGTQKYRAQHPAA